MNPSQDDTGIAAIDRLLAADPRNVLALIRKADHFAATGDSRSASAFYLAALRAAPPAAQVPPDLQRELRRAQETCARYAQDYKGYLRDRLAEQGFDPMRSSARFARSLDIIFGERRIYLQEPRYYYFPELPNVQFYEREQFPWFDEVEAETDAIRAELLEVMRTPGAFSPYVTGHANRPRKDEQGMLNNPDWSAFFLWKNGEPVPANLERCPSVMRALRNVPLATVGNRSPSVLFSMLKPGTHIPPHNGLVNTRLICHLPLIVPDKCRLRVGNETRDWVAGKAWAFDDTIEHEAWNDSDQTRVILLFDVWRPEVSAEERTLVTQLFTAIDAYSGTKPDWEI
ncbi:MAG: aspartyl/asparaginyl beta-hydroxylase domain-containing protein [Proteobacteria bacterium]|nr:aspartyl/asparaginyl beta-hydroxylase domain-containing protein [Pseudomonadota bacterium]